MTQEVFLLSYTKYGDHDAVLHCFCRENGFESFFAKGIYAPKNKKKAFLFPLNELLVYTSDQKKISRMLSNWNRKILNFSRPILERMRFYFLSPIC